MIASDGRTLRLQHCVMLNSGRFRQYLRSDAFASDGERRSSTEKQGGTHSLLGGDGGGSRSEEGEALGEHSAHQNKVQHHVTSPPATYAALSLNPPLASSSFSTWANIKLMLQALQRPPARSPSPIATESVWWSYLRTDAAFLLSA